MLAGKPLNEKAKEEKKTKFVNRIKEEAAALHVSVPADAAVDDNDRKQKLDEVC